MEEIEHLEVAQRLDRLKVCGVYIWDLYRYPLQNIAINKCKNNFSNKVAKRLHLKAVLYFFLALFRHFPFSRKIIFLRHPRLARINQNSFKEIYSDYIISDVCKDERCLIFDPPSLVYDTNNKITRDTIPTTLIYVVSELCFQLIKPFLFGRFTRSKVVNDFFMILVNFLPKGYSKYDFYDDIFARIYKFKLHYTIWRIVFLIYRPKLLILTVSSGNEAVVHAARKSGATVFELQHGSPVVGKLNYDYRSGISKTYVPNIFLSFGGFMHEQLPQLPHEKVIPVGFAHFNHLSNQTPFRRSNCRTNRVLILSQAKTDYALQKWLIDNRDTFQKYEVEIRLHPYYDTVKDLPFKNVPYKLTKAKDYPLYTYMNTFDIVCGMFSTAMYEARALGLGVCIVPSEYNGLMSQFVDRGYGVLCPDIMEPEFLEGFFEVNRTPEIFMPYAAKHLLSAMELTSEG